MCLGRITLSVHAPRQVASRLQRWSATVGSGLRLPVGMFHVEHPWEQSLRLSIPLLE